MIFIKIHFVGEFWLPFICKLYNILQSTKYLVHSVPKTCFGNGKPNWTGTQITKSDICVNLVPEGLGTSL